MCVNSNYVSNNDCGLVWIDSAQYSNAKKKEMTDRQKDRERETSKSRKAEKENFVRNEKC